MLHFRHVLVLAFVVSGCELDAPPPDASAAVDGAGTGRYDGGGTMGLPPIPIGYDAYRRWADWARLRIGARTYMRSTYDRSGGNEGADASHFLRRDAAGRSIALDIAGRGMVTFVRTNHWHGSPWHVVRDGLDEVVSESSTATPTMPVPGSVFLPAAQFPDPLAVTWSTTRGADLDWVPMPFSASLSIAYERTHYGTGYFMYQLLPDDDALTKPLPTWDPNATPPEDVLALLRSAGQDIAPAGNALSGSVTLPEGGSTTIATLDGPAQIRALSFFVPKAAAAAFGRATVKITWDGRSSPSVSAPVALLFGTGSLYNRSNVEYLVKSLPAVVQFRASDVRFALYFPMPYFSGAKIEIVAADAFSGARFEVRTEGLADPPAWLGYFHASYVDHGVPTSGSDLELLDTRHVEGVADWCGHLVGTSFVFSDRANLTTLEGDPRFFFDDSQTPQGQGTGTEEWAGGGDYWGGATMTLPLVGHPVGAPSLASSSSTDDQIESAYRFLLADVMPFGKNARITLEHGGVDESTERYRTVSYWYGRPRACLVQTDAFHVGDLTDESSHRYVSSAASQVESLTSRYELGPDHIGATEVYPATTDTGRHTKGTTEFRIAVDPANVGVLLRRKLDYGYADQQAEVMVSDDVDPPSFVHAATWYLAGSNRSVYSNPPGELDAPESVIETSNRRWRDDELMLPRALTTGRAALRILIRPVSAVWPLLPGTAPTESAWSEYRYTVYSFLAPD